MRFNASEAQEMNGSRSHGFLLSPGFILALTIFVDAIGFGMIIPLLPFFSESLHSGSTALAILIASFSIMQFIFSPILGRSSDKVGRKPILLLSILTSMISFGLFILANSFLLLLISRLIAGLATETGVAQAYIADITSTKDRVKGIGKIGAAHGAGFIVGPAIGGFLSFYGFSAASTAAILLTLINFLFVLFLLPESHRKSLEPQPLIKLNENKLRQIRNIIPRGSIDLILIIFFIVFLSFSAVPVIVPLLGIAYFGIGSMEMSYLFVYLGVIQIVLQGFVIDKLAAKLGDLKLIILSPLLMMTGILLMPIFSNIGVFFLSLTLISVGGGIIRTAVPGYISKATTELKQGKMLGVTNSIGSIATVPGPLMGGVLFEFSGLASPFYVSGFLLLFSVVLGFGALRKS